MTENDNWQDDISIFRVDFEMSFEFSAKAFFTPMCIKILGCFAKLAQFNK
jgi:hypothetical protein